MLSVPVQIGASIQDGGWLTHAQSQVAVVFIVFERFSVDKWKRYKNATVDEIFYFVFVAMKTDTFENALAWMAPTESTRFSG